MSFRFISRPLQIWIPYILSLPSNQSKFHSKNWSCLWYALQSFNSIHLSGSVNITFMGNEILEDLKEKHDALTVNWFLMINFSCMLILLYHYCKYIFLNSIMILSVSYTMVPGTNILMLGWIDGQPKTTKKLIVDLLGKKKSFFWFCWEKIGNPIWHSTVSLNIFKGPQASFWQIYWHRCSCSIAGG